jgi:hypothetical protein
MNRFHMHACALHIDLTDPLGYPVTGASTGSGEGGTVVSDVEIRYEWQTSGEFVSNHFTLQKHFRAGAGLVWMVYYGGNGRSCQFADESGSSAIYVMLSRIRSRTQHPPTQ